MAHGGSSPPFRTKYLQSINGSRGSLGSTPVQLCPLVYRSSIGRLGFQRSGLEALIGGRATHTAARPHSWVFCLSPLPGFHAVRRRLVNHALL